MTRTSLPTLTRRVAVLFALFALCAAGCLTAADKDPAGPGGLPDTTGTDDLGAPQAFFTLHGTDIRGDRWPTDYTGFSLFVCDPSLSAADLARVRTDIPGARLLAYTNVADIPIDQYAGNPYHDALTAAFDSTLCVIDLTHDRIVRLQGYNGTPGSGQPAFVLGPESVEVLVAFHRDVTMDRNWDGMYLDQCTEAFPPWRRALLLSQTLSFDGDGDGVADRIEDLEAQYAEYRPRFTQRLREELGDARILVGNAGGPLADPSLSGLTLEGVGDRFTIAQARGYLAQQEAVGRSPFTAVLWATTNVSRAPSWQLSAEFDGVYYGVIDPAG